MAITFKKLFLKRKIVLALASVIFCDASNGYSSSILSIHGSIDNCVGDRLKKRPWLDNLSNLLKTFEGDEQAKAAWILANPPLALEIKAIQKWDSFVIDNSLIGNFAPEDADKYIKAEFLSEKSKFLYQYTLKNRPSYTDLSTDGIFGELLQKKNIPGFLQPDSPTFQVEVINPLNQIFTAIGENVYHPVLNCFKTLFDPKLRDFKLDNGSNIYDTYYSNFLNYPAEAVEGLRLSLECLQIGRRRPNEEIINLFFPLIMPFIPVHTFTFLNVLEERARPSWADGTVDSPLMFFDALRRICALGEDLNSLSRYLPLDDLFPPNANPIALRNRLAHTAKINLWLSQGNNGLYQFLENDLETFSKKVKSYLNAQSSRSTVDDNDKKWKGFESLRDNLSNSSNPNPNSSLTDDFLARVLGDKLDQILEATPERRSQVEQELENISKKRTKILSKVRNLIKLGAKDPGSFDAEIQKYPLLVDYKARLDFFIEKQKEINQASTDLEKKTLNAPLANSIHNFIDAMEPLDKNLKVEGLKIQDKRKKLREFCGNISSSSGFSNMKYCYAEFLYFFNKAFGLSEASSFSWDIAPQTGIERLFHVLHNVPLDKKKKLKRNQDRIDERFKFIENVRLIFNISEFLQDLTVDPDEIIGNHTKNNHLGNAIQSLKQLQNTTAGAQGALEFLIASFYDQLNAVTDCSDVLESVYKVGKPVRDGIFHSIFADSAKFSGENPKDIAAQEGAILMVNVFYLLQKESEKIRGILSVI